MVKKTTPNINYINWSTSSKTDTLQIHKFVKTFLKAPTDDFHFWKIDKEFYNTEQEYNDSRML